MCKEITQRWLLSLYGRERERERESGRERNEEGVAYSQLSQPQADSQPPASASEPTSHCRPEGNIGPCFDVLMLEKQYSVGMSV